MNDLYEQYLNDDSEPINKEADILHIGSQDPIKELEKLEKKMAAMDVITTARAVRLEEKIRSELDIFCKTNGIGLDTLLEGMYTILSKPENAEILQEAIKEASERRFKRVQSGVIKSAIARLKKMLI